MGFFNRLLLYFIELRIVLPHPPLALLPHRVAGCYGRTIATIAARLWYFRDFGGCYGSWVLWFTVGAMVGVPGAMVHPWVLWYMTLYNYIGSGAMISWEVKGDNS